MACRDKKRGLYLHSAKKNRRYLPYELMGLAVTVMFSNSLVKLSMRREGFFSNPEGQPRVRVELLEINKDQKLQQFSTVSSSY